ncbi:MAG TPA: FkbM family methyltransferase [Anaeromyxobacter sp.]|nr:FkbM family methyltransferase [Anaeromyxobacter sp.]
MPLDPSGLTSRNAFIPHVGWLEHEQGDEVISLLRQGFFEAVEQAFVWLYLRPGDQFVDGGAHLGLYSVLAHRAGRGGVAVHSVEANPRTADLLERNLLRNGVSGRVHRAAIWKEEGLVPFVQEAAGRSAYARVDFTEGPWETAVKAITVDGLIERQEMTEVALLKLDVEGAEPEALEGAAGAISSRLVRVFLVEFAEPNLQRRGFSTAQLGTLISRLGLTLCDFSPEERKLVPCSTENPIWFRNLVAARDPEEVEARLRAAEERNLEVALDILARAAACDRLKELEDLDRYQRLASANEEWARNIEALLAREKELSATLRAWAEDAERRNEALKNAVGLGG